VRRDQQRLLEAAHALVDQRRAGWLGLRLRWLLVQDGRSSSFSFTVGRRRRLLLLLLLFLARERRGSGANQRRRRAGRHRRGDVRMRPVLGPHRPEP
jgi:hypothetical protein